MIFFYYLMKEQCETLALLQIKFPGRIIFEKSDIYCSSMGLFEGQSSC